MTSETAFEQSAARVGAAVLSLSSTEAAAKYISKNSTGMVAASSSASLQRIGLVRHLRNYGCQVADRDLRSFAPRAAAGITGANFGIADTGTVVLDSTDEGTRLVTTLPEDHFILLDPRKIVTDGSAAAALLRRFHQEAPRNFLAYISGPSRTADIERVLTIGVHGPRRLHILLLSGLSEDPMEN